MPCIVVIIIKYMLLNIKQDRIIIFSRYPEAGKTKTRLIPDIGALRAADLQRRMTGETLRTVRKFACTRSIDIEICFEGGDETKMNRWLGNGAIYKRQDVGDLGERIRSAFFKAFLCGCRRVLLCGTDIPGLDIARLEESFDALTRHDVVLGPSTDGGYYLVGLKKNADIFKHIQWGTSSVLDQTIDAAKHMGLSHYLLTPLTDIDTIDDLRQWRPADTVRKPYISVIIPALNEAGNIGESIASAKCEDAEVIVVDGGSTDKTVETAEKGGARVINSPRGRAVQQNRGAAISKGSVLLFLHADTILPENYADDVFETFLDAGNAAGAFQFSTDSHHPLMRMVDYFANIRSQYFKLPYGDQALFVRKEIFEFVGGFQDVAIAEDLFLVRCLSKQGKITLLPKSIITSSRRWENTGIVRTFLINQIIAAGCFLGVPPSMLSSLYKRKEKNVKYKMKV